MITHLHNAIALISPKRLWIIPLFCGTAWLCTILPLLFWWLANGTPKYPDQSNPYVAFISDIGAFSLKPLFITGSILTAFSFTATLVVVHFARYSPLVHGLTDEPPHKKIFSILSVVCAIIASLALVFLTGFDTFRYTQAHWPLLLVCVGFLGAGGALTTTVYGDVTLGYAGKEFDPMRPWTRTSTAIVFIEVLLGVAFVGATVTDQNRIAGILEWCIAIIGAIFVYCFMGYVRVPAVKVKNDLEEEGGAAGEETPLLGGGRAESSGVEDA